MVDEAGDASETPRRALFVQLAFCPTPSLVTAIARLVSDFCRTGLRDLDVTSRFHMAAHELTENITKYSTSSHASLEIELTESSSARLLTLRTKNHTSLDRLAEVEKRLKELQSAADPSKLYDRLIEETAPLEGVSGLGLARIRAEGLFFNYQISGDELTLIVQEPLPLRAPQQAAEHG